MTVNTRESTDVSTLESTDVSNGHRPSGANAEHRTLNRFRIGDYSAGTKCR